MSASISASPVAPLIFRWDAPRRRKLAIAGFLAGSVMAHAICFYIFQIVYPPTVALLPPPARVSVISPTSEEGRTLLQWIEAEDPALATTTVRPADTQTYALPKVQHVPSFSGYEPALKQAPPLIVDLRIPSAQPPAAVPMVRPKAPAETVNAPSSVVFSKEIEGLGPSTLPAIKFSASSNEPPESVRFQIGIGERGDVRYCFSVNSSGDPALDEQAREFLALCRFPARSTAGSMVWGIATIAWGNDVAGPSDAATTTAKP